ncbi:AI-2E family transporter [Nanoarchaeota archaeon]
MHLSFLIFFFVVAIASAFIIKPFFSIIVVSAIIAYVLYPAYRGFLEVFKYKGLAAIFVVLLLLILFMMPIFLVVTAVTKESVDAYRFVADNFKDGKIIYCQNTTNIGCGTYEFLSLRASMYGINLQEYLKDAATSVAAWLVGYVSGFVLNLPVIFLKFFFIIFITYYFLKQGADWVEALKRALPLEKKVRDDIVNKFRDVIHATIYGAVILSIIQGVVAAIGYWLLGVPSPILFGFLTLIATFLPFVGGALVWVPLVIWMLATGLTAGSSVMLWQAFGLFVFGLVVVSNIDNILKPKIVGDRAKMHPLVILLGVFGGLAVFGIIGILIGPVILALFLTALKIYEQDRKHFKL